MTGVGGREREGPTCHLLNNNGTKRASLLLLFVAASAVNGQNVIQIHFGAFCVFYAATQTAIPTHFFLSCGNFADGEFYLARHGV